MGRRQYTNVTRQMTSLLIDLACVYVMASLIDLACVYITDPPSIEQILYFHDCLTF